MKHASITHQKDAVRGCEAFRDKLKEALNQKSGFI
jgi:hypothetical protein